MRAALIGFLILAAADPARAGEADVLEASATCSRESVCTFSVAVRHDDEGWDHYAARWQVLSMDGEILATRILRHPHGEEQPFTRSLDKVELPEGSTSVRIRAGDSVHGLGGAEVLVPLPKPGSPPP